MAWYKTGTLSIAANSKKATGHGTRWADNKQGIGPGQMLLLPGTGAVALYEIASVVSDTELLLVSGPPKAVKEASYAIVTYNGGSYVDFGRELSAQLRYYQRQMEGWQHIMTGEGEVTLEAPDGTQVTLSSFKKLMVDVAGKMDKTALDAKADKSELENKAARGANIDITSLSGLTTPLSIAQGGTGETSKGIVVANETSLTQSIPHATFTKVRFSTKVIDSENAFSGSDYVAPTAGYYLFAAHMRFPNPPSAASVYLKIDSSTSPTKAAVIGQTSKDYWPMDMIFELSCVVYLNKNQSVSLYVYQNTGSTVKNNQHSDLSIFRISNQ